MAYLEYLFCVCMLSHRQQSQQDNHQKICGYLCSFPKGRMFSITLW